MSRAMKVAAADRRRFLRLLGLTGAWSALGAPGLAWAQSGPGGGPKPGGPVKDAPSSPPAASPPGTAAPEPITDEARALAKALTQRYPGKIADADLETVTRDIDGDLKASRRLRERKLANDVEPDVIFRA